MKNERKALLLSVGYGKGHHSAAQALAEELTTRGWRSRTVDVCEVAHPVLFRFTQRLYHACVRHMPWVWGAMYNQLDTADWARLLHLPGIEGSMCQLRRLLEQEKPDLVVCTYPLFGYMLDTLARRAPLRVPYAMVVTDALSAAAGRAWVQMQAPLICLPDAGSMAHVQEQFALPAERLAAPGFPVRSAFAPAKHIPTPGPQGEGLHIVYSAHAPTAQVAADAEALLHHWPLLRLTVVAARRSARLRSLADLHPDRLRLCAGGQDMAALLSSAHFYIGKAGGASVFEAYAAEVPMVVNYALPGQEEGNLALLLQDGAGCLADSTPELVRKLRALLADSAAGWQSMRRAMRTAHRSGGAARTVDELERKFLAP